MDGVLVVDKPAQMTSHDVVDAARRALKTRKVGHGGTLDPDATGVLVLGVGKATRLLSYAQAAPKRYLARVRLGATTTTQDASGGVVERRPVDVSREDLERELEGFVGEIEQIPPMVSAVKIGGERLYRAARRGEEIERPARRVRIDSLQLRSFQDTDAEIDVRCSGGTYIRTLAHDLGERLGCGAHLVTLRRIEASGFSLGDACRLEEMGPDRILPLREAVRPLPDTEVGADDAVSVAHGRPLPFGGGLKEGEPIAIVHEGRLLGVYRRQGERLVADRVIPR